MITTMLLPLFLLGAPAGAAAPAIRAAAGDDPAIQIWISNDRRFLPGDRAKVQVRTREDGYLLVLHVDPDGHLRVLFPLDPNDDYFVRGGRKYEIRGRGDRESFTVDDRKGRGTVYAAVSHDPFRFDQFVLGDHWDYRNLAPQRLPEDPEQDLNELVRRMADAGFDYDVLTYDVLERVVYAGGYDRSYYGHYDCWDSYFGCGRSYYGSPFSLSVGLFFGRPYHRRYYYYDPFYYAGYDPFYDPFFYDPYYYRPVYLYPVGPYRYYNYPYYGGYYQNRYDGWNRPYTPYRFRPADGTRAGYRDRRYGFRSVNTVYLPPVVRGREPVTANPMRRLTDDPIRTRPAPAAERRTRAPAGDAAAPRRATERPAERSRERVPERARERAPDPRTDSRLVRPNIDARRAREPEERRSILPDSRDANGRRNLPTEVRPPSRPDAEPRRAVERPQEAPAPARRAQPRSDAQPDVRRDAPPSDRGSYSPPPRSDGGPRGDPGGGDRGGGGYRSGGGDRSGGGGSGGGGSGGSGGSVSGGDRGGGRRR